MSDPQYSLEATGLTKTYVIHRDILGRPTKTYEAVRGIDIKVERGKTLALVGESGAGKSTVGRLVLRLVEPDGGKVELLGTDMATLTARRLRAFRQRANMIFQDPYTSLNPRIVVGAAIAEPLVAGGVKSRDERQIRVLDALNSVGLAPHHAERFPYEMSGGQLQRVAIARALITNPDFIVCDEPVAALDMSTQAQVINLLRDLQEARGLSYLFISHDLSLVRVLAHDVAVMRNGALVETGNAAEIFADPTEEYTRTLLDAVPIADPAKRRFRARSSV
jgi:oligopeptide transport system ATP-binding protein